MSEPALATAASKDVPGKLLARAPLRLLAALILAAVAWPASAQDAARPAITSHRFDEDWRALCDAARRTEWPDPLKCIALEPGVTLTLGGELRERFEVVRNPDFGIDQGHDHVFLHRLMLHADLRADDAFRAFIQLGAFGESGREGDRAPTDLDRADLVQGFVDMSADFEFGRLTGRGGRQEMSFGSSRLVSVRESPNIRRAFDGGRGFWTSGDYRLDTFYVRPIVIEQGAFDDTTNHAESLWGAYGTGPVLGPLKADLYYLGLHRDRGHFAEGTAEEQRHSMGIRLFGAASGFDWDVEAVYQFGDFGGRDIRAWTIASDWGVTLSGLPLAPRLGLKADIASGDKNPADDRLGTFNALYPKLPYFSEANLIAPANIVDLQPNVQFHPVPTVLTSLGWNVLWRHETADAIYAPPLAPIANTAGTGGSFIGHQAIVGAEWDVTPNITVGSQYVHFWAGTPFGAPAETMSTSSSPRSATSSDEWRSHRPSMFDRHSQSSATRLRRAAAAPGEVLYSIFDTDIRSKTAQIAMIRHKPIADRRVHSVQRNTDEEASNDLGADDEL